MAFIRMSKGDQSRPSDEEYKAVLGDQSPEGLLEFARSNGIDVLPLDVERLAEALGLQVGYMPMDDGLSGILEKTSGGWRILINSFHHPLRRRFTIAHEIAHYLLHRKQKDRFEDLLFARRTSMNDRIEREADKFAAELLMPESEFLRLVNGGVRKLSDLSDKFGASIAAVKFRADQIGLRRRKGR